MCSYDKCGDSAVVSHQGCRKSPLPEANQKFVLTDRCQSSYVNLLTLMWQLLLGGVVSCAFLVFSMVLPFVLFPEAAKATYIHAAWDYNPELSYFDNSAWTYGTDYFLALAMAILACTISTRHSISKSVAVQSRGLLVCYMLSVAAGGIAHQTYPTVESRNTLSFRLLWIVCVGTVTAATGFMGSVASLLVRHDKSRNIACMPEVPLACWLGYAVVTTAFVIAGGMSFQRPACDIFVAGITQFPSTIYMMAVLVCGLPAEPIHLKARLAGMTAFILNAPLLPMFPVLVQYTDMSLGAVNTTLHSCLLVAWTGQGLILRHAVTALSQGALPSPAVPLKRHKVA